MRPGFGQRSRPETPPSASGTGSRRAPIFSGRSCPSLATSPRSSAPENRTHHSLDLDPPRGKTRKKPPAPRSLPPTHRTPPPPTRGGGPVLSVAKRPSFRCRLTGRRDPAETPSEPTSADDSREGPPNRRPARQDPANRRRTPRPSPHRTTRLHRRLRNPPPRRNPLRRPTPSRSRNPLPSRTRIPAPSTPLPTPNRPPPPRRPPWKRA